MDGHDFLIVIRVNIFWYHINKFPNYFMVIFFCFSGLYFQKVKIISNVKAGFMQGFFSTQGDDIEMGKIF